MGSANGVPTVFSVRGQREHDVERRAACDGDGAIDVTGSRGSVPVRAITTAPPRKRNSRPGAQDESESLAMRKEAVEGSFRLDWFAANTWGWSAPPPSG
jgi:hypothetical protein